MTSVLGDDLCLPSLLISMSMIESFTPALAALAVSGSGYSKDGEWS
jgi:hypothetical protein